MMVGDPSHWVERFISIENRLLERIAVVWPLCLSVLPDRPEEDAITINLVHRLSKDIEARKLFHWLEYQFEPFGFTADGLAFSKGQVDMAVLLDQQRERYLAYECKRLNVIYDNGRQSLATPYVNDGLKRFITEQYAEGLPTGCMLGYVLDGDVEFAIESVHAAINDNRQVIGLVQAPAIVAPIADVRRFSTAHTRPATNREIRVSHALIPFPRRRRPAQLGQANGLDETRRRYSRRPSRPKA